MIIAFHLILFDLAEYSTKSHDSLTKYQLMIILEPLCIETAEGRKAYVIEQEALAALATPLRMRVIDAYDAALAQLATATA